MPIALMTLSLILVSALEAKFASGPVIVFLGSLNGAGEGGSSLGLG